MVLAVIVNWNGRDDLLECVDSIKKIDYPKDRYKILVVDNASSDGSQARVSEIHPEVLILKNQKNIGYVKAVNQGIAYGLNSGADYIWIFNNDAVVAKDSLKELLAAAENDKKIGVVAPVIYSYRDPKTVDHAGYKINFWIGWLKKLKIGEEVFKDPQVKIEDVDSAIGCSNLVNTSVFKKIGFFRPIYELYFEETDFNVRAKQEGFRVVIARDAQVWHKNASTMDKFIFHRAFLLLRNLFLFEVLNARLKHLVVFIPYYFLVHVPYFLIRGCFRSLNVKRTRRKVS
jgi:GT2 family glycosyltransferase